MKRDDIRRLQGQNHRCTLGTLKIFCPEEQGDRSFMHDGVSFHDVVSILLRVRRHGGYAKEQN